MSIHIDREGSSPILYNLDEACRTIPGECQVSEISLEYSTKFSRPMFVTDVARHIGLHPFSFWSFRVESPYLKAGLGGYCVNMDGRRIIRAEIREVHGLVVYIPDDFSVQAGEEAKILGFKLAGGEVIQELSPEDFGVGRDYFNPLQAG